MFNASKIAVGDRVTVYTNHHQGPKAIRTVKEINSRAVTLDDDSKWIARSGHAWGTRNHRYYMGSYIDHHEPGDKEKIRRRWALEQIQHIDWRKQPTEALTGVLALIEAHKNAQGIEAEGGDAQRLRAEHESPIANGDAPKE